MLLTNNKDMKSEFKPRTDKVLKYPFFSCKPRTGAQTTTSSSNTTTTKLHGPLRLRLLTKPMLHFMTFAPIITWNKTHFPLIERIEKSNFIQQSFANCSYMGLKKCQSQFIQTEES